jgi:hypothetical protein
VRVGSSARSACTKPALTINAATGDKKMQREDLPDIASPETDEE